ncbi:C69 family dipeptidase [Bulleidia sp. zg-1006]|uniref:C69 family dipeptidase n=1 Tax=Bulleidia sp. zg-1006 TaxID=2806552 RepID=UPI0019397827|nr:C69 family dipeptidase [Bulleidia sp. zg-1006]QRG87333.1 C69 family dipeptidase [Bulleidia sp. zg-1006]
MKKKFLKLGSFALAILLAFPSALTANACTGVIVGGDLTKDGTTIFGRTEDLEVDHNKAYKVHKAGTYKKGSTKIDCGTDCQAGYKHTFSHDSYQYTSVSDTTPEYGEFDEAGYNEKGVIADMTVSASANDKILSVDNYVDNGITEALITTVTLAEADSAKDGIQRMADIVAKYGAAEGNAFVIADKDELWYMEVYSGHQFLAMKYPRDKYSVFPNTFWINKVKLEKGEEKENYITDKTGNYIYSKGLFSTAEKAGTFVGDKEKNIIDAAKSYGPSEYSNGNRYRVYSGIKALNPKSMVKENDKVYDFLQSADKKSIDLRDVMALTRNRLENIGKVANDQKGAYYPIGNRNTMESHIFQVDHNKNDVLRSVMWLALGSPRFSPYIPYHPNQTEGLAQASAEYNEFNENSIYWLATDAMHMAETDLSHFSKIADAEIKAVEQFLLELTDLTPKSAEQATKENISDAKDGLVAVQRIHAEIKAEYEKYLSTKETTSTTYNKRTGAVVQVKAPAGTAKVRVDGHLNKKGDVVTLTDYYGNPVKDLKKPVEVKATSRQFQDGKEYEINDGTSKQVVKVINHSLTYTTKTSKATIKVHKKENPKPEEPKYEVVVRKIDSKLENHKSEEYEAYDISFVSADGKVAKDGKMRKAHLKLEKFNAKDVYILHRKQDNSLEEVKTIHSTKGKEIVFEHNDFSPYYFVKKTTQVTPKPSDKKKASQSAETADKSKVFEFGVVGLAAMTLLAYALKERYSTSH